MLNAIVQVENRDSEIRILVKMLHKVTHEGRSSSAVQQGSGSSAAVMSMPALAAPTPAHLVQSHGEALCAPAHSMQ